MCSVHMHAPQDTMRKYSEKVLGGLMIPASWLLLACNNAGMHTMLLASWLTRSAMQ
jgi:hypothetical protein